MQSKSTLIANAILLLAGVQSKIVTDSPLWANDWYDNQTKIGVKNGVPYSNDEAVDRFIKAPLALEGAVSDYLEKENVQRVQRVFSESQFEETFPFRNDLYTYQGFLNAVGKFPAFCGEQGPSLNSSVYDLDDTCKRELAVLIAHFVQETGAGGDYATQRGKQFWQAGLYWLTEIYCSPGGWGYGSTGCNYAQTWASWARTDYPPQSGVQYYGRGPFQISWNYNYGAFSKVLTESTYDSHMVLLKNPELVQEDSMSAFLSALWFYMTPQAPKPSMHDVASGWYVPTQSDLNKGLVFGFGLTTNIINGGYECGNPRAENQKSKARLNTFKALLTYFDLPAEAQNTLGCKNQPKGDQFPTGNNYGWKPLYFMKNGNLGRCVPTTGQTAYAISTMDDYKRCMCRHFPTNSRNVGGDCPVETQVEIQPVVPDNTTPDTTTPDSTAPDSTAPDNTTPDTTTPDTTAPDTTTPDNTTPDTTAPDTTTPDTTTPDTTAPDTTTPDSTTPDSTTPDDETDENMIEEDEWMYPEENPLDAFQMEAPHGMDSITRRWVVRNRRRVPLAPMAYSQIKPKVCRQRAAAFDKYCFVTQGSPAARFRDYRGSSGECSQDDDFQRFHCLAQQCLFEYCISERDSYIENCQSSYQTFNTQWARAVQAKGCRRWQRRTCVLLRGNYTFTNQEDETKVTNNFWRGQSHFSVDPYTLSTINNFDNLDGTFSTDTCEAYYDMYDDAEQNPASYWAQLI